jgi:hypothetical protein
MYDEDLKNLEEGIRRLKIEYDIFFVGNRRKPPDDLRLRVEKIVKRLADATDMSFSQRFLYNTLIARFYVYRDHWRRTQQENESAEDTDSGVAASKRTPAQEATPKASTREIEVSIADPASEGENVRRLYDELLRLKGVRPGQTPEITYQQFASYIANKTLGIKTAHRCDSVTFRIILENNNIRFFARAGDKASG